MEMDPFILYGNEDSGPNKLAEFSKAKEQACKIFQEFKECLHKVKTYFTDFQQRMKRPTEDDFFPKKDLSEIDDADKKVNEILEILQRNYMKIVYFGRTSNGKSTVINAMLHDHLLPIGLGQTTTAFIEVKGSKEEKATVACDSRETQIVECQETLRKALKDLNKEKHTLIKVTWPGSKCQLLREHIRLVDCPGFNDSFAMDQKLEVVCKNADVFVLVINAVSSISEHDTKYFKEVSRLVSKPNMFVLFNFWDMSSDAEPENQKEARQHHTERATNLLAKELQVVEEWEVKERIFFVSAKEVLGMRMDKTIKKEEKTGVEGRLEEFEAFECTVKTCVSETAIKTKFKTRADSGHDVISELKPVLKRLSTTAKSKLEEKEKELKDIEESFKGCFLEMKKNIQTTLEKVEETVKSELDKQFEDMDNIVVRCHHSFDTKKIEKYKNELDAFVEKTLNESLQKLKESEIEKYISLFTQGVNTKILGIKNNYPILREEHIDLDLHFEGNVQLQSIPKFATALGDNVKIKLSLTQNNVQNLASSVFKVFKSLKGKVLSFTVGGSGTSICVTGIVVGSSAVAITGGAAIGLGMLGITYFVGKEVKNWMKIEKEKVFQQKYADHVKQHKQEFIKSIISHMLQHTERELSNRLEQLQTETMYGLTVFVSQQRKMLAQESRQLTKWRSDFEALDVKLSNFMKEYLK